MTAAHEARAAPARLSHARRVILLALGAGCPRSLPPLALSFAVPLSPRLQWTLARGHRACSRGLRSPPLREAVVRPLQTLSNLLAALREEDFSFRARTAAAGRAGPRLREVNALAETLREQRLGALEATALLRKVMEEIDVAVFAFDAERSCASSTARASACSGGPRSGCSATAPTSWAWRRASPRARRGSWTSRCPGAGRFEVRRGTFRQGGRPWTCSC